MAGKLAKIKRRAGVLERLSTALGVEQADLQLQGRGDAELAMIVTLERVADAVEGLAGKTAQAKSKPAAKATPATLKDVESQLEAETGHDVVKTGTTPPTFVETNKPAPKAKAVKESKNAN